MINAVRRYGWPPPPKFKIGDRVKIINGNSEGVIMGGPYKWMGTVAWRVGFDRGSYTVERGGIRQLEPNLELIDDGN